MLETQQQGSVTFHSRVKGQEGDCGWEEEAQVAQKEFLQPNSGRTDSYNEVSINNVSLLLV